MNTLLADEAHFKASENVNKQNYRYWAQNNEHEIHQRPLHSAKVTVCCAVYSHGINSPYFFENEEERTVNENAERYKIMLKTLLLIDLHPHQQDLMCFQQDGATEHTTEISMQVLRTTFPGRIISRFADITWPTRSPDHSVPDDLLRGCVES